MKRSEPLASGELEGRHEGKRVTTVHPQACCAHRLLISTEGRRDWGNGAQSPKGNTPDPLRAFCPQIGNMKTAKEAAVRGAGLAGGGEVWELAGRQVGAGQSPPM